MFKKKRYWLIPGIILLLVLVFIWQGGTFLVREDGLSSVQYGVVLMGHFPSRILHGIDLYHEGILEEIILVQPSRGKGFDYLKEQGIYTPDETDLSREVAIRMGVNPRDIVIIPGGADSTRAEALLVAGHLEGREGVDKLILITSPSHSRRASIIFSNLLPVEVISSPTSYEEFSGAGWWKRRDWARQVVLEYQKLLHFLLWERFGF